MCIRYRTMLCFVQPPLRMYNVHTLYMYVVMNLKQISNIDALRNTFGPNREASLLQAYIIYYSEFSYIDSINRVHIGNFVLFV